MKFDWIIALLAHLLSKDVCCGLKVSAARGDVQRQSPFISSDVTAIVLPCDWNLIETAWIKTLVGKCNTQEVVCANTFFTQPGSRAVFVLPIGAYHFKNAGMDEYERALNAIERNSMKLKEQTLIHVGDEWEMRAEWKDIGKTSIRPPGGHRGAWLPFDLNQKHLDDLYSKWGQVFRQFENGAGTWIPLGWTPKFQKLHALWATSHSPFGTIKLNSMAKEFKFQAASSRSHAITFIGDQERGGRGKHLKDIRKSLQKVGLTLNDKKDVDQGPLKDSYLDEDDGYITTMADSKFCLDLPGASTECYRLYEALETGCIVVSLSTIALPPALRTHTLYPSECPIVLVTPSDVGPTLKAILDDPFKLDVLQRKQSDFWKDSQNKYQDLIKANACPAASFSSSSSSSTSSNASSSDMSSSDASSSDSSSDASQKTEPLSGDIPTATDREHNIS